MRKLIQKLLKEGLLNENQKITVYRGAGSHYGEEINQGILWVSTSKDYAKMFASKNDDGTFNIETINMIKPNKTFQFPYSNTSQPITTNQLIKIFNRLLGNAIKEIKLSKEDYFKIKNIIKEISDKLGNSVEPFQSKINNPIVSNKISNLFKLLGYEAIKVSDGDITNYGILK
tara:strand:- start:1921 stop:2439 length:519 start_codon:yes stop_codon:yes gene_type:complete